MTKGKLQTSEELDDRVLLNLQNGRKKLKVVGEMGYYRAKWSNGGRLPKEILGKFTSRHAAEEAIKVWLVRREA
jgi:hypothetical protein